MIIICGWCRVSLGEKPPFEDKEESTGMCPPCYKAMMAEVVRERANARAVRAHWLPNAKQARVECG